MRRKTQFRTPVWVLVTVLILLSTAGDLTAEGAQGGPSGPVPWDYPGGSPDTLWGGSGNQGGHLGDPNDYDKTLPPSPDWFVVVIWLLGIGR